MSVCLQHHAVNQALIYSIQNKQLFHYHHTGIDITETHFFIGWEHHYWSAWFHKVEQMANNWRRI